MLTDTDRWQLRRLMERTENLNISGVRDNQLDRRVSAFARRAGIADAAELLRTLSRDTEARERFVDALTINVTNLFRNAEQWRYVAEVLLPDLGPRPRLWSAGCSTGAEPYTMSIIAREAGSVATILASDIDRRALEKAAVGWYPETEMREVPAEYLDRYFIEDGAGYRVAPAVTAGVRFMRHDLLADPLPHGRFDLIACRNVAIYFSEDAKNLLHERLASTLRTGGILFIGGAERISRAREIGLTLDRPQFYRKA